MKTMYFSTVWNETTATIFFFSFCFRSLCRPLLSPARVKVHSSMTAKSSVSQCSLPRGPRRSQVAVSPSAESWEGARCRPPAAGRWPPPPALNRLQRPAHPCRLRRERRLRQAEPQWAVPSGRPTPQVDSPLTEADPEAGPGPAGSSRPIGRGLVTSALTSELSTALSHSRDN